MHFFILLFVGLSIKQSHSLPTVSTQDNVEVEERDIDQINKDLGLMEGDILQNGRRSAISDTRYRWETPVPYTLDGGLDINAKGIILKAFEQYALKSCIDFKLRDTEQNYVSFQKDIGCYSYVGNNRDGGQILSIGEGCDTIAIVEHELLHALGFWHEQSRYDRDEYVTIVWENIIEGLEHNFRKELKNESTTQGTPYDYDSVMHYGQFAFTNGSGRTIITKLPEFQNKIGQRLDMSHYDAVELNKLYNCTSPLALLWQCTFENETMCHMSSCSRSNASWSNETFISGGPHSGHTNLEVSQGSMGLPFTESSTSAPHNSTGPTSAPSNESSTTAPNNSTGSMGPPFAESSTTAPYNSTGTDIFMHFSTANGEEGDRAKMETRWMSPRRNCTVQCLQFYYYHSGNESDQLNIWIREYDEESDTDTRRLVWQITGPPADYWQLQHVPLNATKTFKVEFEGRKGNGSSSGGFSIDDINLSETECPHQTWQIRNVEQLMASDTTLHSPRYFSRAGYGYQILTYLRPTHVAAFVRLVSGENDDQLQWPCPWRQIILQMLDQNPDIQQRMSRQLSFTTDPTSQFAFVWDDPREGGRLFNDSNGESYYVNFGFGLSVFTTLEEMRDRGFIKGGDVFFQVEMRDISELHFNRTLECNTVLTPQNVSSDDVDDGPCMPFRRVVTSTTPTTTTTTTTDSSSSLQVSLSVMVILMAWVLLWSH